MNYQEYQGDEYRGQILSWFETDFKETAKSTTKTQRLDDGKVSYKFSAVNNTGYNFDRFSFKVKILNKANGQEIGTATIRTGEWKVGETKNFRSKIAIPPDVRSIPSTQPWRVGKRTDPVSDGRRVPLSLSKQ